MGAFGGAGHSRLVAVFAQWWWWALVAVVGWQKWWIAVACGHQSDEDDE